MSASIIRTIVTMLVGALLGWAVKANIPLPEAATTEVVQVVVTAIYYMAFRWLEEQWPSVGRIFLAAGLTDKKPSYGTPTPVE